MLIIDFNRFINFLNDPEDDGAGSKRDGDISQTRDVARGEDANGGDGQIGGEFDAP